MLPSFSDEAIVSPCAPETWAFSDSNAHPTLSNCDHAHPTAAPNTIAEFVSGQFHDRVAVIWSGARMAEYLTASDARRHLWHAWLAVRFPAGIECNAMSANLAYNLLSGARGKSLAAQAYGACPPGLLNVLGRLGPSARAPDSYRGLVTVLSRGGPASKYLVHAKTLPDDVIVGLAELPGDARLAQIAIDLLLKRRFSPRDMGRFGWALSRLGALYGPEAVASVSAAAEPWDALWDALFDRDFPPPPFPETAELAAVASAPAFRAVAARFENCLAHPSVAHGALRQVANGSAYFYEWRGDEAALMRFQRIGALGWHLEEARRIGNRSLSEDTRVEIARALESLPTVCPLIAPESTDLVLEDERHFFWRYD